MQRTMGLSGFEPPTSRLSGVRSEPTELQARHVSFPTTGQRLGRPKPESSLLKEKI